MDPEGSQQRARARVGYRYEADTVPQVLADISETYDGPLTLAKDNLVWNITADDITVRSIVSPDEAWSVLGPNTPPPPDHTKPDQLSKWSLDHRWDISDVSAEMIKEFNEKHGLK